MKKANRIILATKCSIIRDAQIAEKNEIAREFHNENLRLEKIMLEERDRALVEEELKREQERTNLLKYSREIRKQLEERESIRAREVDKIEEEAIAMKKALDVIKKVVDIQNFHFCTKRELLIKNVLCPNNFRRNKKRPSFAMQRFKKYERASINQKVGVNTFESWSLRKVSRVFSTLYGVGILVSQRTAKYPAQSMLTANSKCLSSNNL